MCTYCKYKTVSYIYNIYMCVFLIFLFIPILCIYIMYEQAGTSWNWFYFNDIQLWQFSWKKPSKGTHPFGLRFLCFAFQPMPCQGTVPTKKKLMEHLHIGNIWVFYKIDWKKLIESGSTSMFLHIVKGKNWFFSVGNAFFKCNFPAIIEDLISLS